MPRAQVYISKNTYKRIQLIVNEKKMTMLIERKPIYPQLQPCYWISVYESMNFSERKS